MLQVPELLFIMLKGQFSHSVFGNTFGPFDAGIIFHQNAITLGRQTTEFDGFLTIELIFEATQVSIMHVLGNFGQVIFLLLHFEDEGICQRKDVGTGPYPCFTPSLTRIMHQNARGRECSEQDARKQGHVHFAHIQEAAGQADVLFGLHFGRGVAQESGCICDVSEASNSVARLDSVQNFLPIVLWSQQSGGCIQFRLFATFTWGKIT